VIIDAFIGFCAALLIYAAFHWLKESLYFPMRVGENVRIRVLIEVCGDAPELENVAKSVLFLKNSGRLTGEVQLLDQGMSAETAAVAERLAEDEIISFVD